MSTALVPLAILLFLATYPWRAVPLLVPGVHRLPAPVRAYIRLVGPAVLAALAASGTFLGTDALGHPIFHVGIEWLAVGIAVALVAARRGLLLALVVAVGLVAVARAAALA